jgi:autotransporter-associated beta strand protein
MKKMFFAVALVATACCCVHASSYYVRDNADSSSDSNSLRYAIITSNAASGSNTLSWSGTGGAITLGSALTAINGGTTLDVTNSSAAVTISGYSMTINSGQVTFKNDAGAQTWTISSSINGAGELVKTGGGTLVLTNSNSYTGGTEIDAGILNINSDAALGSSSGQITFNGGTLQNAASISSARTVLINSGGGTFDTNGYNMALSGIVNGTGVLTKAGTGTLTLSHENTYSGGTVVSSGTLATGATCALGTGAVTVSSDGTLDLSSYAESVASYSGSGILRLTLASGLTNLTVSGTANIGGTLALSFSPQYISAGETFTPISAGTLSGTFSGIVSPAAIDFVPTYNSGTLVLTAELVPYTGIAQTDNQKAVAAALEPLRSTSSGDIATVIENLDTLYTSDFLAALDQIGPEALFSMQGLAMSGSNLQSDTLSRRMDLALSGAKPKIALDVRGSSVPVEGAAPAESKTDAGGFFASLVGDAGKSRSTENTPGYTFYNGGVMTGFDYLISEHLVTGIYGGYMHGNASITYPGSGTVKDDSLRYGVYAGTHGGALHLNLSAGMASDFFSTERDIAFADINRAATAKPNATELNLYAGTHYDIKNGDSDTFSPLAELNYDRFRIGSFTESGADALDLSVANQTLESMRSDLGVRYDDKSVVDGYRLASYISAGWRHEFKGTNSVEASLASGAAQFSVTSGNGGNDGLLAGVGTSAELGGAKTLNLDYSGDFRTHMTVHALNLGLAWKF